jgi:hypothetical protein
MDLTPEQVALYRERMTAHQNQPRTRKCAICGVSKCREWLFAYERLALAGQLMALRCQKSQR